MKIAILVTSIFLTLTNVTYAKCELDKAAIGQDIDLSEIADPELQAMIEENNPKCEFEDKKTCESFTMQNLFNLDINPCKWKEESSKEEVSEFSCQKESSKCVRCSDNKLYCTKGGVNLKNANFYWPMNKPSVDSGNRKNKTIYEYLGNGGHHPASIGVQPD